LRGDAVTVRLTEGGIVETEIITDASAGRVRNRQYASICGRTVVTEVVLRTHPPSVTVSGTIPTLPAALASPVRIAAADEQGGGLAGLLGKVGERISFRERFGSESSSSLNVISANTISFLNVHMFKGVKW
jgi:hypothetical protein